MRVVLIAVLMALLAGPAWAQDADPANWITKSPGDTSQGHVGTIKAGVVGYYQFTAAAHSAAFNVTSSLADVCLDTDIASATAADARVKVHITLGADTAVRSIVPATGTIDESDCFTLTRGRWYLEVSTAPDGGKTALATISGRDA